MSKHEDAFRGYHRSSKSYYSKSVDGVHIMFGMYHDDGSTTGEMMMNWINISGRLCAHIECFSDSWEVLGMFSDLISEMAKLDGVHIQEEDFAMILDRCGFRDLTEYNDPNSHKYDVLTITEKYGSTHNIKKVYELEVDLTELQSNQSVCWGDGKTFYYLLTEKDA